MYKNPQSPPPTQTPSKTRTAPITVIHHNVRDRVETIIAPETLNDGSHYFAIPPRPKNPAPESPTTVEVTQHHYEHHNPRIDKPSQTTETATRAIYSQAKPYTGLLFNRATQQNPNALEHKHSDKNHHLMPF